MNEAPVNDEDHLVLKFGGTSVASSGRVARAARRVRAHVRRGRRVVVVVSAAGDTTDRLLRRAAALGGTMASPAAREVDRALTTGEDRSATLLAVALWGLGIPARSLTGAEAGLVATGPHGRGRIADVAVAPLRAILQDGVVPVVSGFQAQRPDGETVTLGRGGSDVTAVSLAAALDAPCHIVTDVKGVYDRDPNLHAAARLLPRLDHTALERLTAQGARVIHPAAARLARERAVTLRVYHHAAPAGRPAGTRVATERAAGSGQTAGSAPAPVSVGGGAA